MLKSASVSLETKTDGSQITFSFLTDGLPFSYSRYLSSLKRCPRRVPKAKRSTNPQKKATISKNLSIVMPENYMDKITGGEIKVI
jgi:hypothetical protein